MENEKFTPGPWSILFNDKTKVVLENKGVAIFVADTYGGFTKNEIEEEANAVLISAAPDLYNALKNLKECLESYFGKTEKDFFEDCDNGELYFAREYNVACNVLKKARGEK